MWKVLRSGGAAVLLAWHSLPPVASAQNMTRELFTLLHFTKRLLTQQQ
jgi:hypothetical protein